MTVLHSPRPLDSDCVWLFCVPVAQSELWTIRGGGKLYLNHNRDINQTWRADMEASIEQADANWPELLEDNSV